MKIDIVTHIVPPKYKVALGKIAPHLESHVGKVPPLYDVDRRFRIMDNYGEMKQVLTLAMTAALIFEDPKSGADLARRANDEMAELVARHPDRFAAGVASLPLTDMDAAAKELDRAIVDLKLKGIQLFTPRKGVPLDLQGFLPIIEKMATYDLPIWIHPFRPIDRDDYRKYFVNHVFGWPYESSAAMAYLVFDGLFERFPGIKIIIHHCGAMVPFFDQKIEGGYDASGSIHGMKEEGLNRPLLEYFKMFYADTALSGGTAGLMCGYAFFGADHLLFGTDMPYDSEHGSRLLRETIRSVDQMAIPDSEKKRVYEGNATRLLGL